MTIEQVYKLIDASFPFRKQYRWDKSGLTLNAEKNTEVTGVLLCLDLDWRTLTEAVRCHANLVVCHHPVFKGPSTQVLMRTAKKAGVSFIAAHSNFDRSPQGMNRALGEKLGLIDMKQHKDGITMLGRLKEPMSHKDLALHAKKAFNVQQVTVYACRSEPVRTVGLVGGAGMGHIAEVRKSGIDCFITGDVKWHGHREAHAYKIDVIDVEHYAEQVFIEVIEKVLSKSGLRIHKMYPEDIRRVY